MDIKKIHSSVILILYQLILIEIYGLLIMIIIVFVKYHMMEMFQLHLNMIFSHVIQGIYSFLTIYLLIIFRSISVNPNGDTIIVIPDGLHIICVLKENSMNILAGKKKIKGYKDGNIHDSLFNYPYDVYWHSNGIYIVDK